MVAESEATGARGLAPLTGTAGDDGEFLRSV